MEKCQICRSRISEEDLAVAVSYTHLEFHEGDGDLCCDLGTRETGVCPACGIFFDQTEKRSYVLSVSYTHLVTADNKEVVEKADKFIL